MGMVASHHGSHIDAEYVPRPLKGSAARLLISVGWGNTYDHPKQHSLAIYAEKGWKARSTWERDRCPHGGGHRHSLGNRLALFPDATSPHCSCGRVPAAHLCLSDGSEEGVGAPKLAAEVTDEVTATVSA